MEGRRKEGVRKEEGSREGRREGKEEKREKEREKGYPRLELREAHGGHITLGALDTCAESRVQIMKPPESPWVSIYE